MSTKQKRFILPEDEIPRYWYNIQADMVNKPMPPLNPKTKEPLKPEDPIWDCPNLLITPHCSGDLSLASTVEETVRLFLENLKCYAEGKPMKRIIDFDKGY